MRLRWTRLVGLLVNAAATGRLSSVNVALAKRAIGGPLPNRAQSVGVEIAKYVLLGHFACDDPAVGKNVHAVERALIATPDSGTRGQWPRPRLRVCGKRSRWLQLVR